MHNEACVLQNQVMKILKQYSKIMICCFLLQNLRVEFDDQGNLKNITNRNKNFTVRFSSQGFYWYTSKYKIFLFILIICISLFRFSRQ